MANEATTDRACPLRDLDSLAHAAPDEQSKLIEDFLHTHFREIQRAARTAARFYGRHHNHELLGDVESIALQDAWDVCKQVAAGDLDPKKIRSFRNYISVRIRTPLRTLIEQTEVAPSGSYSSEFRRATALERLRDDMVQELGRIPRDTEVIEEFNRRAYATSKDPQRQGRLAQRDDIGFHRPAVPIGETVGGDDEASEAAMRSVATREFIPVYNDEDPGVLITPWEGPAFLWAVADACARRDPLVGAAAEVWLEAATGDAHQDKATLSEMRRVTGYDRQRIEAVIDEIRMVAMEVLSEMTDLSTEEMLGSPGGSAQGPP